MSGTCRPQDVEIDFLFINTEAPLIVALVIAGALGALIGWALPHVRRSRRAEELLREFQKQAAAPAATPAATKN